MAYAGVDPRFGSPFAYEETDTGLELGFFSCNTSAVLKLFHEPTLAGAALKQWRDKARRALETGRRLCEHYEGLFSRFIPTSDISRINGSGAAPCPIAADTFDLLTAALSYCECSGGLFDITIAPASRLWDFAGGVIADARALAEATAHVDWRQLELGTTSDGGPEEVPPYWARLRDPTMALDLGGIAKGWIVDRLGESLGNAGFAEYLINFGGSVLVSGRPPAGGPWRIGIRNPLERDQMAGFVVLDHGAAVTSGVYERSFTVGGRRYHHVLDPKSGWPVETDALAVTVFAERALDAEGFSTTLLALGVRKGLRFAIEQPEITQAIFLDTRARFHTAL